MTHGVPYKIIHIDNKSYEILVLYKGAVIFGNMLLEKGFIFESNITKKYFKENIEETIKLSNKISQ